MAKTLKTGTLYRSAAIARADVQEDSRTVELSFSSEEPYERYFGTEILDHGGKAVRLGRLKAGGPLLLDHDTRKQVGVIEKVSIADRKGRAVVRFSKSAAGEEVFQDVLDGIRQSVSVGYRIHKMRQEESDPDNPVFRATDWEPLEISLVAVPADITVGVGRSAPSGPEHETHIIRQTTERGVTMDPKLRAYLVGKGLASDATEEDAYRYMNAMIARGEFDFNQAGAAPAAGGTRDGEQNVIARERTRIAEITAIGKKFNLGSEAERAITEGTGVDAFRAQVMDKIGTSEPLRTRDPNIGLTQREKRAYSLFKALRVLAWPNNEEFRRNAGFELECSRAVEKVMGRAAKGIFLPHDVLGDGFQRTLTAGTATDGAELVADELKAGMFIEVLRNKLVVASLGARLLTGLVGDVLIPRKTSGSAAGWVSTETGNVAESEAQFDQVALTPKTLGAYTQISRQLLLQSSMDIEALVRDDLAMAVALGIQTAGLYGTNADGQPKGIKLQTNVNIPTKFAAATPTWAEIVALETAVAADNADFGTMAYLISATMRGGLKTQPKESGFPVYVWNDSSPESPLNGYKCGVSNAVAGVDAFFGNWADLLIGFWGGLDILVDPYTGGLAGTIRVIVHESVDVAVRHGQSFAWNDNAHV